MISAVESMGQDGGMGKRGGCFAGAVRGGKVSRSCLVKICRKSVPGRGGSKCEGPEV